MQVYPKKVGNLPEVSVPIHIRIDNNQVYIADDQASVHFYSLKGAALTYQKQVAHRGEGPQECIAEPFMILTNDILYMFTFGKCMYFTRDGNYLKEFRVNSSIFKTVVPVGDKFATRKYNGGYNNFEISICSLSKDRLLEHHKLLYVYSLKKYLRKGNKVQSIWYPDRFFYSVYDDKVFIFDSTRGLFTEIYDANGNKLNQIKLDVERIKVPDDIKKAVEEKVKNSPYWEQFNSTYYLDFPEYYPPFRDFAVDDGKIYFITYKQKNPLKLEENSREVVIADWKGKLLKRTFITIDPRAGFDTFYINKGKFYYVVDNVETEEWELHAEDIK